MRWVRLALSLAFFVSVCALLGGLSTLDTGGNEWAGVVGGGIVGLFFGLVFGGVRGAWLDMFYPPGPDGTELESERGSLTPPNRSG